jgi:alpha-tubulin suppressor-like RCC1 family protein
VQVTALGNAVASVSAGDQHTCAIKTDGTMWCWGYNFYGQLGDGTNTQQPSPVQVMTTGTFGLVNAGGEHTCGRKADGTLWCWGDNNVGQVGDGTTTNRNTPVQVTGLASAVGEVAAGEDHSCARLVDETLWCWGSNAQSQLGDGSQNDSNVPVWVDRLGSTVTEVSAGWHITCARKNDNSLWCWGSNDYGELGNNSTLQRTIPTAVTTSTGLGPINEVSAGQYFTCATDIYSKTWCWGSSLTGQLGTGTLNNSLVPIQPLNFINPFIPASDLATELALAGLLLISGLALVERRRFRSR